MARRRAAQRREVQADPVFNSRLVTKFINKMMLNGKRSLASRMFYEAIDLLAEGKDRQDGFKVFEQAIDNVKPHIEVKSRRIGGANYQVPVEVRPVRRLTLAIRWIITYAKQRREKTFARKLAGELLDASNNSGLATKKREDVHRMAEANKAFAHFKW